MFCCKTLSDEEKASRELDKDIKSSKMKEDSKVKLLLLGAGESGKSTVFKQMKILYGVSASEEEKEHYTTVVYHNTIGAMKSILDQASIWEIHDQIACTSEVSVLDQLPDASIVDGAVGRAIKTLWSDPTVQEIWNRRTEFQIVDSMKYFFDKIDDIMADGYVASEQDFLYTRVRTTGVVTSAYEIEGKVFEMFDVGGQRNERRKWIHCFDDVTAVIFVAALSEYDQVLFESSDTNRVDEALSLFEDICQNPVFADSAMILFLNKHDLFEEKIHSRPIEQTALWSDFKATSKETLTQEAMDYFTDKFLAKAGDARDVFVHHTTATDTSNVKFVFEACRTVILEKNLKESGFGY